MLINFKKLREDAILPARGSEYAAGYDLFVPKEASRIYLGPGQTELIKLGFACSFAHSVKISDDLYALQLGLQVEVRSRSGLAKKGIVVANSPGTIDSDYRGEWGVLLRNDSNEPYLVDPGAKIAQALLTPYFPMNFVEVEDLDNTGRGEGGFGSTGK